MFQKILNQSTIILIIVKLTTLIAISKNLSRNLLSDTGRLIYILRLESFFEYLLFR